MKRIEMNPNKGENGKNAKGIIRRYLLEGFFRELVEVDKIGGEK